MSHRPLDQLRREAKAADRAPHLKKKHLPGADVIDVLDKSVLGGAYHHEGPYDATLWARNTSYQSSPVVATRGTNAEAIQATPRENIKDSLDKHVPLQGTAFIPPGMPGYDGRPMTYEEGADLMRESDAPGGAYKRWEGIVGLPLSILEPS
jgi:Pal1 cell morphology protein